MKNDKNRSYDLWEDPTPWDSGKKKVWCLHEGRIVEGAESSKGFYEVLSTIQVSNRIVYTNVIPLPEDHVAPRTAKGRQKLLQFMKNRVLAVKAYLTSQMNNVDGMVRDLDSQLAMA